MQTHPLMGKNDDDAEAGAYRTRRPQRREDVEEVREARMQQVGYEINEVSRAPQQEGDPTRYVSRRARHTGIVSEELPESAPRAMTMNDEDYDDGIQYVSVMPPKRKSKIVEEVTLQTSAPAKRGRKAKKEREEVPFENMGRDPRDNRPRYEDVDFEERAKQEHLDSLYDDDYDDDDFGGKGKLGIILGIVALILIIFLIFRTVSLGSKLEDAQNQLTQSQDYKEKYEEIQLEKMQLEEQLDAIQNPDANADNADEDAEDNEDAADNSTSGNTSTSTGAGKEYTIKEGDTMWTIAQSQMGNGADYQKILDANGMKESDPLKPGNKIKIPTAN